MNKLLPTNSSNWYVILRLVDVMSNITITKTTICNSSIVQCKN